MTHLKATGQSQAFSVSLEAQKAPAGSYRVIEALDDFLVIFKPAGLQVHPDSKNQKSTLANFLLNDFPEIKRAGDSWERPGIVHRLDKDTAGLMLIARNQAAFEALKKLFQARKIKKTYWALVFGVPTKKEGIMEASIGRALKNTALRTVGPYAKDLKKAKTKYRILEEFFPNLSPSAKNRYNSRSNAFALVEARPHTGRTHQIRVHLKALGHPLVGDPLYKFKRQTFPLDSSRLFLFAKELKFAFKGKKYHFQTELDPQLAEIIKALRAISKDQGLTRLDEILGERE